MENKNNKIEEVVSTAMKNLSEIISSNAVLGKEISTVNGDTLFPVSKITFGVLSGGGEYGKTGIFSNGKCHPFSAGNGALVSVKPCGFLIKTSAGEYKLINSENSLDYFVDKVVDFVDKIKEK